MGRDCQAPGPPRAISPPVLAFGAGSHCLAVAFASAPTEALVTPSSMARREQLRPGQVVYCAAFNESDEAYPGTVRGFDDYGRVVRRAFANQAHAVAIISRMTL